MSEATSFYLAMSAVLASWTVVHAWTIVAAWRSAAREPVARVLALLPIGAPVYALRGGRVGIVVLWIALTAVYVALIAGPWTAVGT